MNKTESTGLVDRALFVAGMEQRSPGTLDRAAIARLIPHAGAMVLLDECIAWTDDSIYCRTGSHRNPDHPLRTSSGLLAVAAIEMAAQAVALHAGWARRDVVGPSAGMLASVRDVRFTRARVDDVPGPLHVHAERLHADARQLQYRFRVDGVDGELICEGRALLVLGDRP